MQYKANQTAFAHWKKDRAELSRLLLTKLSNELLLKLLVYLSDLHIHQDFLWGMSTIRDEANQLLAHLPAVSITSNEKERYPKKALCELLEEAVVRTNTFSFAPVFPGQHSPEVPYPIAFEDHVARIHELTLHIRIPTPKAATTPSRSMTPKTTNQQRRYLGKDRSLHYPHIYAEVLDLKMKMHALPIPYTSFAAGPRWGEGDMESHGRFSWPGGRLRDTY
ncbi:hypothetical protein LTR37_001544 [Vermiconidia calcicola]|uniref:Uncharacterized protein n=1 Tax=Vermiconidia calcicola TaxID=1690605 RepID=A0ACC3NVG9_9PEZI|nr:hypothetical protein LTR37_001544 [Vermiconidia calcicola]